MEKELTKKIQVDNPEGESEVLSNFLIRKIDEQNVELKELYNSMLEFKSFIFGSDGEKTNEDETSRTYNGLADALEYKVKQNDVVLFRCRSLFNNIRFKIQ